MDTNTPPTTIVASPTPRVWIGCLACYNAGRLIGEWFNAITADEVTPADVHRGQTRARPDCEEIWCMDLDNMPVNREMSPHEAAEWGRALASVDEHLRPALHAWVSSGDYVTQGDGELPSISDFEERFAGEWESFDDYAHDLAESTGLLNDAPAELARYFNWKSWISDLAMEYTTADAPNGGVYVFRNL